MPTSRAAWLLFWAGIPTRVGVGRKFYEVATGMRTVSRHGYVPLRHEADYCLDLGRAIGARTDSTDDVLRAEVFVTAGERANAARELRALGLGDGDFVLGIHPTGGGSAPNWPVERWQELATALAAASGTGVVHLVTGESATPPWPAAGRVIDRRGRRPLRALIADLAQCDLVVGSSTGPLHLAAALGVPTVGLFCPLPACSPTLWGPRGGDAAFVLPPPGCCPGRCPRDPKHCQFEEISVAAVAAAVAIAMDRARAHPRVTPR